MEYKPPQKTDNRQQVKQSLEKIPILEGKNLWPETWVRKRKSEN